MYGCCGLGQDSTDATSTDIMGPTLEEIAGGPVDTLTVSDVADYVSTGSTSDPSKLSQIASIVQAIGPAAQQILQQVQLGQIAASAPLASSPVVRAAIVGASPISTTVSSLAANPVVLVGAGLVLVLLLARRK